MVFSLATMTALIGAREVRRRQGRRRSARRAAVLPELVHHIGGLTGDTLNLGGLESDALLMAEVVRDLSGLVRGRERTRLTEALCALNVDQALRDLIRTGWANQRVLAAEALVFFPGEETYDALLKACHSATPRVRLAALRSAIELGRPPPIDDMLDSVVGGSERASLLFSDLLQRAAKSQIEGAIASLERPDLPRHLRIMVMQALGASEDERALGPLLAATRSKDNEIRAGAFAALSTLGLPGVEDVVADGLADDDWRVRLKAIECVRRMGLTEFFAPVMVCADDEVWWVRYRAGQTLMSLANDDVAKLRLFVERAADQARQFARLHGRPSPPTRGHGAP